MKTFHTNAVEWYFAKPFVSLNPYHKRAIPPHSGGLSPFWLLGSGFVLFIIYGIIESFLPKSIAFLLGGVGAFLIILGFIYLFIHDRMYRKKLKAQTQYPQLKGEELLLYKLTQEGVYVNQLNQGEKKMDFVKWEGFDSAYLHKTQMIFNERPNTNKRSSYKKIVREEFEVAQTELGSFPYQADYKYENHVSLFLQKGNGLPSVQLPIPVDWSEERLEEFTYAVSILTGLDVENRKHEKHLT